GDSAMTRTSATLSILLALAVLPASAQSPAPAHPPAPAKPPAQANPTTPAKPSTAPKTPAVPATPQMTFPTPEKAAEGLIAAAAAFDLEALKKILGSDGLDLVVTADKVQD